MYTTGSVVPSSDRFQGLVYLKYILYFILFLNKLCIEQQFINICIMYMIAVL